MNTAGHSSTLSLLYVFTLLSILMGIDYKTFTRKQNLRIYFSVAFMCIGNHFLAHYVGSDALGRFMVVSMHLPMFLLFLFIGKRGPVKTGFMILSAIVFTTPSILVGNWAYRSLFPGSLEAKLLASVLTYAVMLLLAQYIFRSSFNYLIHYSDNLFFLLFSLVPLAFYAYVLVAVNLDVSSLTGAASFIVRYMPTLIVFLLYFLLPYIYKSVSEKHIMKTAQTALQQKLTSADEQISLLNETNTQMAIFRHDIRHQLILLDGLLTSGDLKQAQNFIQNAMTDLESIGPKKFCENPTVNLLCSAYDDKAKHLGITFKVNALLPKELPLSDTELCSVVSNGLENALLAASKPETSEKWIDFYSEIKLNKLLIQIKNTYSGQITMENGLPLSQREGHGYGCLSIQTIAQRNGGLCSFKANDGVFTLQLIIPSPAK